MRHKHLPARQKRRFVPRTTQSDHGLPIAPNWLAKVPAPARPDQVWVVGITYVATGQGWTCLAVKGSPISVSGQVRKSDPVKQPFY